MSTDGIHVLPYLPTKERYDRVYALLGSVTCRKFYGVRNDSLAVLRRYGSVGPIGEFSLEKDCEPLELGDPALGATASDPMFFVVDDWYNERDRFHRVEAEPHAIQRGLIGAVMAMLKENGGWEVYFALTEGGLLVSEDKVEFEGAGFEGCLSLGDIEDRCVVAN